APTPGAGDPTRRETAPGSPRTSSPTSQPRPHLLLDDPRPLGVVEGARDARPRPDGVQLRALGLGPSAGQLAVAAPRVERAPRRRVEQAREGGRGSEWARSG